MPPQQDDYRYQNPPTNQPDQPADPPSQSEATQRNPFKTTQQVDTRSVLGEAMTRTTTPSPIIPPSSELAAAALSSQVVEGISDDDPDYVPPQLTPLAEAYTKYEIQLYSSGMDIQQVEQNLAAWRQQYAGGASSSEIMYPDYSEFSEATEPPVAGSDQQAAAPAMQQPQPDSTPQPPAPSPGTEMAHRIPQSGEVDDGELRIR